MTTNHFFRGSLLKIAPTSTSSGLHAHLRLKQTHRLEHMDVAHVPADIGMTDMASTCAAWATCSQQNRHTRHAVRPGRSPPRSLREASLAERFAHSQLAVAVKK